METLIVLSNCAIVIVSIHVAHRSLPEEHKHWIRARVRQCIDCLPLVNSPYRGRHRNP
jgi:hypothetical protein